MQHSINYPWIGMVSSLHILVHLVGCVDALAEAQATMLSLWLVHRTPNQTLLQLALRLLHPLSQTPACAWAACAQGGAVYLMTQLLPVVQAPPTEKVVLSNIRHHRNFLLLPLLWAQNLSKFPAMIVLYKKRF